MGLFMNSISLSNFLLESSLAIEISPKLVGQIKFFAGKFSDHNNIPKIGRAILRTRGMNGLTIGYLLKGQV